jgi:hypothetical protein
LSTRFKILTIEQSLEEIFLATPDPTQSNVMTETRTLPYVEFETYTLRKREELNDMKDVQSILKMKETEMKKVMGMLDDTALDGLSGAMKHAINWRAAHLGVQPRYWELVTPDYPRQFARGRPNLGDSAVFKHGTLNLETETLSDYSLYKDAQLVPYSFKAFQRTDGKFKCSTQ